MVYKLQRVSGRSLIPVTTLLQEISNIPLDETSLELYRNDLGLNTGADLKQIFAAISTSVTWLGPK